MNTGLWQVKSKSDPRWDCKGRSEMLTARPFPPECEIRLAKLRKDFGPDPVDLLITLLGDRLKVQSNADEFKTNN